ncbi:Kunitz/Bovine pancreatic trypsin inhibitor domain protein [Onchocerca flexuosa]|uniref:Kunitz/Bovine pancreatic trypsin inhibitor domain protein n=1 Tax=Onchocerca flexuosa TaxID=387005 RepID=A0A238C458_9BILA|nr:Kunitz/Bovine pancreatic trypsin inhibitor domain protein [Onchocerca flexuosa]
MHYHNAIDALTFPDNFDSFLEMLFEHTECEDFLADDKWTNIGLRDCKPYVCDFPRELCRRPAAKYQDETSNTCIKIPEDQHNFTGLATKSIDSSADICNLDQPKGRFCGFQIKVAYNRNNERCEQFWFPGCRTIETNQNLFDTVEECMEKTKICKGTGSFVPFFTTRHPAFTETPSLPVPVVAPFLATTVIPRAIVPRITEHTSAKPWVSPATRSSRFLPWFGGIPSEVINPYVQITEPQVQQPYWLTNHSGAGSLLGLISNSISQFTGGGYGGSEETTDEGGGGLFQQIPQFLRLLQSG